VTIQLAPTLQRPLAQHFLDPRRQHYKTLHLITMTKEIYSAFDTTYAEPVESGMRVDEWVGECGTEAEGLDEAVLEGGKGEWGFFQSRGLGRMETLCKG